MALAARVLTHARTCVRILACVQTHNYPPHPRLTNTEYARQLTHSSPSHSLPSHVLTARPHPASDLTPVSPTQVHLPATSPACPRPLCHNRHLRGSIYGLRHPLRWQMQKPRNQRMSQLQFFTVAPVAPRVFASSSLISMRTSVWRCISCII